MNPFKVLQNLSDEQSQTDSDSEDESDISQMEIANEGVTEDMVSVVGKNQNGDSNTDH